MESIQQILTSELNKAFTALFGLSADFPSHQFQKTKSEFVGDITLVVFPYLKISGKSPEQTANLLGDYLKSNSRIVAGYNVIKGFLNLEIQTAYYVKYFNQFKAEAVAEATGQTILVEYSSPNTNKPLHLGHVRNNLLGFAISNILKANGHQVKMVNLVNDRGIHICKSMIAWQKFGNGETPESSGLKGDHLVGKYYVIFDREYKKQVAQLISDGVTKEEAEKMAPLMLETQEMLRKWEAGEVEVKNLWEKMNSWVYDGFDKTYKLLGVSFDKIYYESNTYLLGKDIVNMGLEKGLFFKKEDGAVRIDLTSDGLDEKVLLRSDGTSVYMTQDLGTAAQRAEEWKADKMVYVVGNEQDYHFKVLRLILQKMGFKWADGIFHLSYGMVELPSGKMKSREGTVVDADDLVLGMIEQAGQTTIELGKTDGLSNDDAQKLYRQIGLAALKYFILKVDPKKKMLFNPEESIDFNGNTGPFIQYTHARISSLCRKYKDLGGQISDTIPEAFVQVNEKEKSLLKLIYDYKGILAEAGENYSPAVVANYVYDLCKEFNQFYHDVSILRETDESVKSFRVALSAKSASIVKHGMGLLGIEVPERM